MDENLIFYLNKLSHIIVADALDKEKIIYSKKIDERFFKKCIRRVRQKGCDVLLNKSTQPLLKDPCITDYGGNWSPTTLITDYAREFKMQGVKQFHDVIVNSLKTLEENQYDCLRDLLKLLLLLKRPFAESSTNFTLHKSIHGSDFSTSSIDSFFLLADEYSNQKLSKTSFKRAIQYEESWTKHFDSKFQLLGELSKKNLLTPDKVSLDSIFTANSINQNQSQSNSFVFTDFFTVKNHRSDKNLFNANSDTFDNETPLLDTFVDNPIQHKLPYLTISETYSKNSYVNQSSEQIKRKLFSISENKPSLITSVYSEKVENEKIDRSSEILLKRNSNCSHSFSILYEKKNCRSQESCMNSNENLLMCKEKKKNESNSICKSNVSSKAIILGLWEQEQALIKDFKPELAVNFPSLRMITKAEFVEDVKYLLTGINSKTFQYSQSGKCFHMEYGTCLDDVTPESLYHFSKEFLDIGNSYMSLNLFVSTIHKNNFDTCTSISQAFWKSIFDFLELHYSIVLEIPLTINLMSLKSCTRDMLEMIMAVAEICKVTKPNQDLPQGGELLSYLLQVAEKINNKCVVNIVFGILQNCCTVYFRCMLQKWMFKGKLDKQNNEFFVDCRRQKIKTRSRAYYNSFFIANEKIPSFLQGYEESVFNCGKSIHFLKLFNPEDNFCQLLDKIDYPNMYLCHSEEELEKLEKEFNDYKNRVIQHCGNSISIIDLKNEEKEQEKCFLEYVKNCKKMQEQQRELMRLKELEGAKARKEQQNKLLNEQRNIIVAKKEKEKMEEKAERIKFEEECKKEEAKKELALEQQKNVVKKYYDELLVNLEKRLNMAELRKQHLKHLIESEVKKGSSNDLLDVINDNTVETNTEKVIAEVDINSNTAPSETEIVKKIEDLENNEVLPEEHYDENLNPSSTPTNNNNQSTVRAVKNDNESQVINNNLEETSANDNKVERKLENSCDNVRKSISYRTLAAQEAAKNKCKVLKSEFGLRVDSEEKIEQPKRKDSSLSELERNRRRVLESEYQILKNYSEVFSIKSVASNMEVAKESFNSVIMMKSVSATSEISEDFDVVPLERKMDCVDLENPPKVMNSESEVAIINSSASFLTPNDGLSEENVSNSDIVQVEVEGVVSESNSTGSALINPNYQDALKRDTDIFCHKSSYQDMFCNLKDRETETPCTDFMKLQRFLKKSVLVPLKIQEKLANDALLKHLLLGENLLSHLKSLRSYFFLNDGEFGRSFTHNTFRSLAKCMEPHQFFERSNLSNIVNEALNYTIHNCEPNSQNLSFQIVKMPPFLNHSSHDVLSSFELSYKVEWPLNIILTDKAIDKYKSVFRFLLKLKRINWTLNENFLLLNSHFKMKKTNLEVLVGSSHYHKIQIYRHAMTQIMITLDDYIFSNGIQLPWIYFLKDLETTENIDHLYQKHVRYIKDVLTRCFLSKNSEDLLSCIYSLIELALKFHYTTKSSVFEIVNGRYEHPKFDILKSTFNEFCSVIKTFLRTLKTKISANQVIRSHYVLIEKFDLKLT